MKKICRIVSLALILSLAVSLLALPVMAEGGGAAEERFLFTIGDSIPLRVDRGTWVDKTEEALPGNPSGCTGSRWVKDSYFSQIYKHYGFTNGYSDARTGWRMYEALLSLDSRYQPDRYSYEWLPVWSGTGVDTIIADRDRTVANLKKADLVLIGIGSNEILGTLCWLVEQKIEEMTAYTPFKQAAMEAIARAKKCASEQEFIMTLLEFAETAGYITTLLQSLVIDVAKARATYGPHWDALISRIREVNPTAKIAVVGLYNSTDSFLIVQQGMSETIARAAKELTDSVIDGLNFYMRCGSRYASQYTFVDTSSVDHLTDSTDGAHLGPVGQNQMTQLIINALGDTFKVPCRHANTHTEKAVVPTRLTLGYTGDTVCSDCGKKLHSGEFITFADACPHEHSRVTGQIKPTFLLPGMTGTKYCPDCGKILESSRPYR